MPCERAQNHDQNITKFAIIKQGVNASRADKDVCPVFIPRQGYFLPAVVYSAGNPGTDIEMYYPFSNNISSNVIPLANVFCLYC